MNEKARGESEKETHTDRESADEKKSKNKKREYTFLARIQTKLNLAKIRCTGQWQAALHHTISKAAV